MFNILIKKWRGAGSVCFVVLFLGLFSANEAVSLTISSDTSIAELEGEATSLRKELDALKSSNAQKQNEINILTQENTDLTTFLQNPQNQVQTFQCRGDRQLAGSAMADTLSGASNDQQNCGGAQGASHPKGGGFVASTATVHATAFVGPNATVCNTALVAQTARIEGSARIYGSAQVTSQAVVKDSAHVYGNAQVTQNARVEGSARIYGNGIVNATAKVSGSAFVFENGRVMGSAKVYGNAKVYQKGAVYGQAKVSGNARVYGQGGNHTGGRVFGDAQVYGDSHIIGSAHIMGQARVAGGKIYGNAKVYGKAQVREDAKIFGKAQVFGEAHIAQQAWVYGEAVQVYQNAKVAGSAKVYGKARIYGKSWVFGQAQVLEGANVYGTAKVYGTCIMKTNISSGECTKPETRTPASDSSTSGSTTGTTDSTGSEDEGERTPYGPDVDCSELPAEELPQCSTDQNDAFMNSAFVRATNWHLDQLNHDGVMALYFPDNSAARAQCDRDHCPGRDPTNNADDLTYCSGISQWEICRTNANHDIEDATTRCYDRVKSDRQTCHANHCPSLVGKTMMNLQGSHIAPCFDNSDWRSCIDATNTARDACPTGGGSSTGSSSTGSSSTGSSSTGSGSPRSPDATDGDGITTTEDWHSLGPSSNNNILDFLNLEVLGD